MRFFNKKNEPVQQSAPVKQPMVQKADPELERLLEEEERIEREYKEAKWEADLDRKILDSLDPKVRQWLQYDYNLPSDWARESDYYFVQKGWFNEFGTRIDLEAAIIAAYEASVVRVTLTRKAAAVLPPTPETSLIQTVMASYMEDDDSELLFRTIVTLVDLYVDVEAYNMPHETKGNASKEVTRAIVLDITLTAIAENLETENPGNGDRVIISRSCHTDTFRKGN